MKQDRTSYSQAMNEWSSKSAQKSFLGQFRNRLLHPPYHASFPEKVLGYTLRLAALGVMLFVLTYFVARAMVNSSNYRAHLAEEFANFYGGTNAQMGGIGWGLFNNTLGLRTFEMEGKPESFFRKASAKSIFLDLGWQYMHDDWHFDQVVVQEMELELRNGLLGEPVELLPAPNALPTNRVDLPELKVGQSQSPVDPADPILLGAGFALKPDGKKMTIDSYRIHALTLKWGGQSTTSEGIITNASTTLEHPSDDKTAWDLVCTSGTLSQNWLRDAEIEKFHLRISKGQAELKSALFRMENGGRISAQGPIALGDVPTANLELLISKVNLRKFAPPELSRYFQATISGQGKITGTTNRETGVRFEAVRCQLVDPVPTIMDEKPKRRDVDSEVPSKAYIMDLPVLRAIYRCTNERRFQKMPLHEGTFELETGAGKLVLRNLDLVSKDVARIRGEIECIEQPREFVDTATGVATKSTSYTLSGKLMIGLPVAMVEKDLTPNIQKTLFETSAEGMRWMVVQFQNEDPANLTAAAAAEIDKLLRESLGDVIR